MDIASLKICALVPNLARSITLASFCKLATSSRMVTGSPPGTVEGLPPRLVVPFLGFGMHAMLAQNFGFRSFLPRWLPNRLRNRVTVRTYESLFSVFVVKTLK